MIILTINIISRGKNHYAIRTIVVDKKLYVFTAQCKEDNYEELKGILIILNTNFHSYHNIVDDIAKIINTLKVQEKEI